MYVFKNFMKNHVKKIIVQQDEVNMNMNSK